MIGETYLNKLIQNMKPLLNEGEYVFVSVKSLANIDLEDVIYHFKEKEGITLVIERQKADLLRLSYAFVASWITLKIHSSLEAVGLTAAFSNALANEGISCNVIAGFYHDHIFVGKEDAIKAMTVLNEMSNS